MESLKLEEIETFKEMYEKEDYACRESACARTELKDIVYLPLNAAKLVREFNVEVKTRGITAQLKSGRCWMFSLLNILREQVAEKCNLKEFKLSANYIIFYDKLEKANNYLEMVIANADKPLNDRMNEYILDGVGDGGYFEMAKDLVEKYGVVPADTMPDTYQACHTEKFLYLFNLLLHKDASVLRSAVKEGKDVQALKKEMLAEIYRMECICFGKPVSSFEFSYRDEEGNFHSDAHITPKEFYEKYCAVELEDYVTLTNQITDNKPLHSHYTYHFIGNMADKNNDSINVTWKELEDACVQQLKDGKPVWFGCDSQAYGDRQTGVWDQDSFAYASMFGIDFDMEKSERLKYRVSYATHAMILTGVHLDEEENPVRWKVENSWGKELGKDGYFVLSEKYFREYVYEAIILKKYLTREQLEVLAKEPVEILPWESDC